LISDRIKATRKEVRKFGLLFGGICILIAGYGWYRGGTAWPWFICASVVFTLSGLFLYPALKPVYIVWMKFAQLLAWINTRVILGLAYYLVITPISVFMRLTGKDLLNQRINRSAGSYWKQRDRTPAEPARYERLF